MLEFSWAAFTFAIVNFLILVGLLYRLLHKPLLRTLEERRRRIEGTRQDAERAAQEADTARQEYEGKLAAVGEERGNLLAQARRETQESREKILAKAREEAEKEVARVRRDWERQRREALESIQRDIADVSLDLSRGILQKLTDADLDERLLELLDRELSRLASPPADGERAPTPSGGAPVRVVSAQPLQEQQRHSIERHIQAIADEPAEVRFDTDEDLIAGARVEFASLAVDASLADILEAARERIAEIAPEQPEEDQD